MTVSLSGLSTSLSTLLGQSSGSAATEGVPALTYSKTGKSSSATAAPSPNGVTISAAAKAAAADVADNAKEFATVGKETRVALDAAKKAGKGADLSELSGRALAAMVLDKSDQFSAGERAAAKKQLNQRTRNDFMSTVGSSASLTSLANYNQLMISDYDSMSVEEREVRGWTAQTRSQAAAFVATASNTSTSSLFDLLNQQD
ncbi:hypothetical protein [Sphingomonas montanisoli]|uniref:Uncharacterized protein n=1 Tax=Sphingomonas montanisoli TaxID=2606412 RepID=A0A5D9C0V3_9SPHN|nr:hypothetical protein [Sphingomonas montanisoli]TZG24660.1 hypothetical protein FYJ91_18760 [Sphingomonas montanisoli]